MFSKVISYALLALPVISGVLADFTIDTPTGLASCGQTQLSWKGGKAPYNLIVVLAKDPCGKELEVWDTNATSQTWVAKYAAGTVLQISAEDKTGADAWTKNITVGAGTDSSCLGNAAVQPPAAVPVGGVNTGNSGKLAGAAPSMMPFSTPTAVLAGLFAALTLAL